MHVGWIATTRNKSLCYLGATNAFVQLFWFQFVEFLRTHEREPFKDSAMYKQKC